MLRKLTVFRGWKPRTRRSSPGGNAIFSRPAIAGRTSGTIASKDRLAAALSCSDGERLHRMSECPLHARATTVIAFPGGAQAGPIQSNSNRLAPRCHASIRTGRSRWARRSSSVCRRQRGPSSTSSNGPRSLRRRNPRSRIGTLVSLTALLLRHRKEQRRDEGGRLKARREVNRTWDQHATPRGGVAISFELCSLPGGDKAHDP